jgi:GT2 family glycosyltransferase
MTPTSITAGEACTTDGKFLRIQGQRFLVKGVSYGTFAPDASALQFPSQEIIRADFAQMAKAGVNTVRVYTRPSAALLDEAARHGLRLILGIPWAQHLAFLDDARLCRDIRREVRAQVADLARHPSTLLFALGNEIPQAVVRWHGRARIERFLHDVYDEAKSTAPDALFAYVNYPPTEYLDTSPFDVCAFNVYLHDAAAFGAYITRLQNLAGTRPLLLSEIGADSVRLGQEGQAALVAMQLRTAFTEGACGAVVFSWTDEWWRGGRAVDDWAFGLVDRRRQPKLALHAAARVFGTASVRDGRRRFPKVSVVVCAYNAASTLEECLTSLERLAYPSYEIILVNDGSTDETVAIARRHPLVRRVDVPNGGLGAARNVGLSEATGEIVAYTDADVRVDPDWLTFLVQPFLRSDAVGVGGPNVVPADDSWGAQCVARAPGGPTHVLLDDTVAEHVPGCNMAFRREALLGIGGFDPIFVKAGDDVDVCWRLQARGWRIGFAPAALVWHHHRGSIRAYWRQQVGYGEGETWLMHRHPGKFARGRIVWSGHIYSPLPLLKSLSGSKINAGPCGTAGFPSVYRTEAQALAYLPHSGRWHVAAGLLMLIGAGALLVGAPQGPLLLALGLGALAITIVRCIAYGLRSDLRAVPRVGPLGARLSRAICRAHIAWLHFIQPLARVRGRVRGWIEPSYTRRRAPAEWWRTDAATLRATAPVARWLITRPIETRFWSGRWIDAYDFCSRLARQLRLQRVVRAVGVDDGWWEKKDLSIDAGTWLRLEVQVLVEDHGANGCVCRVAARARPTGQFAALVGTTAALMAVTPELVGPPLVAAALLAPAAAAVLLVDLIRAWTAFRGACAEAAGELALVPLESERPPSERTADEPRAPAAARGMAARVVRALPRRRTATRLAAGHREADPVPPHREPTPVPHGRVRLS